MWATIFRDGHETLGAAVLDRAPAATWQETPLAPVGNDRWTGSFRVDACGPLGVHRRGVGRPLRVVAGRAAAQGRTRARPTSRASCRRARCSSGCDGSTSRRRSPRPRATAARRRGRATLDVDVDRERARFGSWYELFPRSWGGFAGVEQVLPRARRARLRRRLPAADPPDRRHEPQGPQQRADGRAGDPGSPWAIGDAGGRPHGDPPGARHDRGLRAARRRGREHGLEIALDFAIQCSPDHPWLSEHPEWFHRRPDGTLKYAENPPKRYQDIYNVNFDSAGLAGAVGGAARRRPLLGRARRAVFRVDNPHTKPLRVLGVADPRGARGRPRVDLPRRGVHAAGDDGRARQGRLQPVLHVLHLEEHEAELAEFITELTRSDCRSSSGRTSSRTRRTSSTSTCSAAAGRRSRRGSCSRRRCRRPTGSTPATSPSRTCRCGRAARSTSTRRSTRSRRGRSTGPLLPLVRRLNEIRRAEPGAAVPRGRRVPRDRERPPVRLRGAAGGQRRVVCVNLDPRAGARASCIVPASLGLPPAVRGRRAPDRGGVRVGHRPQLRPPRPGPHSRQHASVTRAKSCTDARPGRTGSARARALVRGGPAVVQARRLLRDPHPRLLRRERRRLRRPPRADPRSSTTSSGSASTASGCCRCTPARSATAATTSPTSTRSIPTTARSRTSARSSTRRTSAASGSSPTWS